MADVAAKTTTPRPRTRTAGAATKTTTATPKTTVKPAPAKAATKAVSAPADGVQEIKMELVPAGETKNFAKFSVPAELKGVCAGNLYVPLGATTVRVLVIGADASE
jgi:hypothetical protein